MGAVSTLTRTHCRCAYVCKLMRSISQCVPDAISSIVYRMCVCVHVCVCCVCVCVCACVFEHALVIQSRRSSVRNHRKI